MMRFIPLALLACLLLPITRAVAADEYTLLDTRTYVMTDRYEVVNTGTQPVSQVVIKLLASATDDPGAPASLAASLYQQRIKYSTEPKFSAVSTDKLGNIIGTINLGTLQPGERRTVTMRKLVKNSGIRFAEDIFTLKPDYATFLADPANARFLQFIKPSPHVESDAADVAAGVALLDNATPPATLARDIFATVNTALTYDDNPAYSHQGALSAVHTRRGVCTEFSALFVAYCRALKIPARVVAGYWIDDKLAQTMQQDVPLNVTPHLHTWPEFYLPGAGWIPAEPTFMMTVDGKRTPDYHHFAALPPAERHLIWAYGLEVEHVHDFDISYISPDQHATCSFKLAEQSATWVDDNTTTLN